MDDTPFHCSVSNDLMGVLTRNSNRAPYTQALDIQHS